MAPYNIEHDIDAFVKKSKDKALRDIQSNLEHKNKDLRAKYASEFVHIIAPVVRYMYTSPMISILRGLQLLNSVLHLQNIVLFELIKSELEKYIFNLKSFTRPLLDYDSVTEDKIRREANLLWDRLNKSRDDSNSTIQMRTRSQTSSSSTNEASKSSSPTAEKKCPKCKQIERVVLSCCNETYCKYCFTSYVLDNVERHLQNIACPCLKGAIHGLETPMIISVLTMKVAGNYFERLKRFGRKFELMECKECKGPACTDEETMLLGQCGKCNIVFCISCRGPYHGYTDCPKLPTTKTNIKEADDKTKNDKSPPRKVDECNGATALDYELEYYKGQEKLQNQRQASIDTAFDTGLNQDELFPWEISQDPTSSKRSNFTGEYSCLADGKWLDDVVIERAIKIILDKLGREEEIAVFESYVYSYFINQPEEDFGRMILDKSISSKRFIFALMNTEAQTVGGHWIIGVVDRKNRTITIMDTSMVMSPRFYRKFFYFLLNAVYISQNGLDFDASQWKLEVNLNTCQQQNSYDCGALLIANIYAYTRCKAITNPPSSFGVRKWIYNLLKSHEMIQEKDPVPNMDNGQATAKYNSAKFDNIPEFNPRGLKYVFST